MYSHTHLPLINRPTRVTATTATLIDSIFTNNIDSKHDSLSGIFPITLSDHYLVWHVSHLLIPQTGPAYFLKRQITEVNKNKFTELVSNTDWTSVLNSEDTQLAFIDFHSTFLSPKPRFRGAGGARRCVGGTPLRTVRWLTTTWFWWWSPWRCSARSSDRWCARSRRGRCYHPAHPALII